MNGYRKAPGVAVVAGLLWCGNALDAADTDLVEERLERRGDRIKVKRDCQGDRVNRRLDQKAQRIDCDADRRGSSSDSRSGSC